ncbi:hypothetical protein [Herbaspirillum huttiense]|uniref:hypothetical protein n=1 Tax=Herbaspirillum huttiense TaxID=863372 RepID=UPI0031D9B73F
MTKLQTGLVGNCLPRDCFLGKIVFGKNLYASHRVVCMKKAGLDLTRNKGEIMQPAALVIVMIAVIVALGVFLLKRKKKQDSHVSQVIPRYVAMPVSAAEESQSELAGKLAIVDAHSQPLVTIEPVPFTKAYDEATTVSLTDNGVLSRLSGLLGAAPSLTVAAASNGKQLMEVVVNGNLVRAADGNGLRAIAMGPKGIMEHARLFETKNLQTLINAAAVWQVASVIVAQKHLADISKKLDEIKAGVQSISSFLDEQRRSRIESTYDYLSQAYRAILGGELSLSVRAELESCERDLSEIQRHLVREYQRVSETNAEDKDTFGSKDLTENIGKKLSKLEQLGRDIELCAKTRIAAWHVFSLYPGEHPLKAARRTSIEESIDQLDRLMPGFKSAIEKEIAGIKSFWNREETLATRRASLIEKLHSTHNILVAGSQTAKNGIEKSSELLLTHDQPTRMWFQLKNGVITEARLAA